MLGNVIWFVSAPFFSLLSQAIFCLCGTVSNAKFADFNAYFLVS